MIRVAQGEAFHEDGAMAVAQFIEGLDRIGKSGGNVSAVLEWLKLDDQRLIRSLLNAACAGDLLYEALRRANKAFTENMALAEEARKRYGTFESRVQLVMNQLMNLGIELFEATMCTLRNVAKR